MRQQISSGSPFEAKIGFARAVRVGDIVAVAGTAPIAEGGGTACPGDAYGQTKRTLEIALEALAKAGLSKDDVVRTRIFLTDIADWEAAGRAHGETFTGNRPACTFMQVSGFISPEWLVEIEVDAVASGGPGG